MCDKAGDTYPSTIKFVPECVIKQLIEAFLYLILFLIGIKPKKCLTELFINMKLKNA